jgi:hypothetical protein
MLKLMSKERFFILMNAAAVGIALVAAIVNFFVGPFNAGMWIVPVFMAAFSTITCILVRAFLRQADDPSPPWMVRLCGKRIADFLHWLFQYNARFVSWVFLCATPLFFLLLAILLLIFSIRGEISSGR